MQCFGERIFQRAFTKTYACFEGLWMPFGPPFGSLRARIYPVTLRTPALSPPYWRSPAPIRQKWPISAVWHAGGGGTMWPTPPIGCRRVPTHPPEPWGAGGGGGTATLSRAGSYRAPTIIDHFPNFQRGSCVFLLLLCLGLIADLGSSAR